MEITIPTLPDEVIRLECLRMATECAETHQDAVSISLVFVELVENGCAGICQGCRDSLNKTVR